eukprot:tig00022080_g23801.t1
MFAASLFQCLEHRRVSIPGVSTVSRVASPVPRAGPPSTSKVEAPRSSGSRRRAETGLRRFCCLQPAATLRGAKQRLCRTPRAPTAYKLAPADQPAFILYAVPAGPIYAELQAYQDGILRDIGRNAQHDYFPHCTLTGFLRPGEGGEGAVDDPDALRALLIDAFGAALEARPSYRRPRAVFVEGPDFVGLHLHDTADFEAFATAFRDQIAARCPPLASGVRLKRQLHVSMAYGFERGHEAAVRERARGVAARWTPEALAGVRWDMGLFEKRGAAWVTLASRPGPGPP